ncbi:hypothetical protein F5Y10DRAFT_134817 [Nemania abortiva]|nr:hypothetical protein F5Y10DRAFT_134817 [Nemania abortiva]
MEGTPTKKHVIDPNGDVIIHLRNFDAPFAVLPKNGQLYVPTAPSSIFGTDITTSFGGIFNSQTKQPQLPSNGLKHEPIWATAPRPGDNAVTSETQKEPSTAQPEIHFQVSSAHLTLASRYFGRALRGAFKEAQPGIDGLRHVDASDWNAEALLIVLRVIHGRNRQVPKRLSLETLAKIAVIVDYYDCHEAFDAFAEIWFQQIEQSPVPDRLDRDLVLILHVSWVFRRADKFRDATKMVLLQSKGSLNTLNLPIPTEITSAINGRREKVLRHLGSVLGDLAARFRQETPNCSFECASMNLGALTRQIHNDKELNDITISFGSLDGHSVVLSMKAARNIRSPAWNHSQPKGLFSPGYSCRLDTLVRISVAKVDEDLEGFSLEAFAKAV